MTDVTRGKAGNNERMAFAFDLRRVRPSGLAGELVVAIETGTSVDPTGLDRQFARTPYAVSFAVDRIQLTLVTLHVLYGEGGGAAPPSCGRSPRGSRAGPKEERHWNQNLIALGDFNIDRRGDPLYDAFTSTGLEPAPQLNEVPRTIFGDPGHEQVLRPDRVVLGRGARARALAPGLAARAASTSCRTCSGDLTKTALSWRISDHYPLWVEFSVAVSQRSRTEDVAEPARGECDDPLPHRLRDRRGARLRDRHGARLGRPGDDRASPIVLAFFFGYLLTSLPLLRSGLSLREVVPIALAADTISIAIMEIVDNGVLLVYPGAMDAGLGDALFWWSLAFALAVAWVVTFPVNRWLISRGRGHAVVHAHHSRRSPPPSWRRTSWLGQPGKHD